MTVSGSDITGSPFSYNSDFAVFRVDSQNSVHVLDAVTVSGILAMLRRGWFIRAGAKAPSAGFGCVAGVVFYNDGTMNLPNRLSILRLILSVVFVGVLSVPGAAWSASAAFFIFVVAGLTDFFDGYLARKYNLITDLGKLLDPIADKILVSAALIELVAYNGVMPVETPAWIVIAVLAREFSITGLRSLAAAKGVILAAERIGKHKTISQIVTVLIGLAILSGIQIFSGSESSCGGNHWLEFAFTAFAWLYKISLWVTLILTVWSGLAYFVKNYKLVLEGK